MLCRKVLAGNRSKDVKVFKIIPTRILLDMIGIFLLMQLGFTCLFVLIGIFLQDVLSKIPVSQIPFLIPYIFPFSQSFGGQFVMVFTSVMIYTRILLNRENLALQSSGISTWRLMSPSFVLAFFMSIVCFIMTDLNYSWGTDGIQKTLLSSLETIIYRTLENDKSIPIGDDFILGVNHVEGKKLYGLYLTSQDISNSYTCSAESAELRIGPAALVTAPDEICYKGMTNEVYHYDPRDTSLVVKLSFRNLEIHYNTSQISTPIERTVLVSMNELEELQARNPNHVGSMSLLQLKNYEESKKEEIDSVEQEIALQSALCLQTGNMEGFKAPRWKNEFYERLKKCNYDIRRAKIEPTRRLAFAFNCFFLTWVCTPLSLWKGQKGALMFICIWVMPLLFLFFPLFMLLLNVVKESQITPLILWLPNLILFFVGCKLIRKAM